MANVCSKAQAETCAAQATASGIGKGVKEVYVPEWAGFPGAAVAPGSTGDVQQYCLRLNDGTDGYNCEYLRQFQKRFPTSWEGNFAAENHAKVLFLNED